MAMTRETVQDVVIEAIRSTLGCEEDQAIEPDSRLMAELGAESVDLTDIMGRVSRRLKVELRMEALDDELLASMSRAEMEQGLITPPAVAVLKKYFPNARAGEIQEGMPFHDVPFLISVGSLTDMAMVALEQSQQS
jgi:acyl carrier protein